MAIRKIENRVLAVILSLLLAVTLLTVTGLGGTASAESDPTWVKTVAGVGTTAIKAPTAPGSIEDAWTGSYVWYGKYYGQPVKYRVLDPKSTAYGGSTILLGPVHHGQGGGHIPLQVIQPGG